MSGSAPLVLKLSYKVRTVHDLHFGYSLSSDNAPKPEPPPSRPLRVVSRRPFGADEVVKALHFETHLADAPALSHLTVRGEGQGSILAVDANLIVLGWYFPTCLSQVYLVYDAVEQSITMIPSHPRPLRTPCQPGVKVKSETAAALGVLVARAPGGGYALVKMAETSIYEGYDAMPVEKQDVLYVWRSSSSGFPGWDLISARFPSMFKSHCVGHSYMTVLAFTCGGYAFWANLSRGVMHCRVDAMLSAASDGGPDQLELDFINLPVPVGRSDDPPCPISFALELRSDMYRTIGRSGQSSVKFVTIDGFVQLRDFVDCTLKVWTLSPEEDMTRWTERSLCLGSLTEQDEFKKAGLPTDMMPMYPSLSAEEDDVVYFMLGEYKKCCRAHKRSMSKNRCNGYIPAAKNSRYHLRVDMRRGVLLASARLQISPYVHIASTSVVPCQ